jgi:hypothetical protein
LLWLTIFQDRRELAAAADLRPCTSSVVTKRFRYTLIVRPAAPACRPESKLQTLQQRLGEISDCATTRNLLLER